MQGRELIHSVSQDKQQTRNLWGDNEQREKKTNINDIIKTIIQKIQSSTTAKFFIALVVFLFFAGGILDNMVDCSGNLGHDVLKMFATPTVVFIQTLVIVALVWIIIWMAFSDRKSEVTHIRFSYSL